MRANQCQLPAYCGPNQRSFGNQIGQNYGFNYNYGNYNYGQVIPFQYGGQYATAGEGVDNYDSYDVSLKIIFLFPKLFVTRGHKNSVE
jgi:hypothetical protein